MKNTFIVTRRNHDLYVDTGDDKYLVPVTMEDIKDGALLSILTEGEEKTFTVQDTR